MLSVLANLILLIVEVSYSPTPSIVRPRKYSSLRRYSLGIKESELKKNEDDLIDYTENCAVDHVANGENSSLGDYIVDPYTCTENAEEN